MENRRMTYLSLMDICQFLSLEDRRKLVRGHREFRRILQKLPFSFKTVCFEYQDDCAAWWQYHKITLDGLTWEIRRSEDDLKTVTLPSGKVVDVKSDKKISGELVPRFIMYYFGRKGTKIQKLIVKDYQFPTFNIPAMKVQQLHFQRLEDAADENLLTYLANSHFKEVAVIETDHLEVLWDDLRRYKITTDLLMIKSHDAFDVLENDGIAKKVHAIDALSSRASIVRNLKIFKEDVGEKKSIGTVYMGSSELSDYPANVNSEESWLGTFRRELKAKFKYYGERNGLCLEMSGNRELFLFGRKHNLDEFEEEDGEIRILFRAEVLKKGTTLFYHELPACLQEKYRTSDFELRRLQVVAERRRRDMAQREAERVAQREAERVNRLRARAIQLEQERADRRAAIAQRELRNTTSYKLKRWLQRDGWKVVIMAIVMIPFTALYMIEGMILFVVIFTIFIVKREGDDGNEDEEEDH